MAIRSREELTLADLFTHTLGNLIALTAPEERRNLPTPSQLLNASDAEISIPPALFRLVQLVLLPEVLGASAGPVLYVAAKRFSRSLEMQSIQDLKSWFSYMTLGDLEIELDEEKVLVKLSKCMTCYRLPATGTPLCDFERGLIDGVLERITGTDVITKETLCWGLGDTVCQFEAYVADGEGYVYAEDGSQREVQRRLLAGIADQSDIALENLRLVTDRNFAETRDSLTGMYNFRHLREHAALELARARRYDRKVAFVMLDIDGFAAVNTAVGEAGGDAVLRQWADQLRALLRTCDLTCRYGADEFLLVLPETGDAQADQVLERLLAALKEMRSRAGDRTFELSASAGVATFPKDGNLVEELVAKATTTMYIAKSRGGGQVGFFSPAAETAPEEGTPQTEA
jgi:diguanylate cyclase (GGDEF)-like protein